MKIKDLEEIGVGKQFQDTLCVILENSYLFKDFRRKEDELDSYLVIITSGKAKILKYDGIKNMKEVAIVRKGATLGKMSILDDFPLSATVITAEDSEVALTTKSNL